ncbi:hypothetical protein [Caballeronia novacaledonica]|uniref:hypothetical protein n=1 Tax=Caballeronia novacaledonica TaxID=1544861 RepID=UPI003857D8AF
MRAESGTPREFHRARVQHLSEFGVLRQDLARARDQLRTAVPLIGTHDAAREDITVDGTKPFAVVHRGQLGDADFLVTRESAREAVDSLAVHCGLRSVEVRRVIEREARDDEHRAERDAYPSNSGQGFPR